MSEHIALIWKKLDHLARMPYTVTPTHIPYLLILEPKVFGDALG